MGTVAYPGDFANGKIIRIAKLKLRRNLTFQHKIDGLTFSI